MFNTLYQNILREQSYEIKVLQGLDEESCRLLCTYLSGGAYFLMRQWLMEDVPKSPKEIASIALKIIDKDAVFR